MFCLLVDVFVASTTLVDVFADVHTLLFRHKDSLSPLNCRHCKTPSFQVHRIFLVVARSLGL